MPTQRAFLSASSLGVCAAALLCLGCTGNPSYFPFLIPPGRIVPTHAKPAFGYFANFDRRACKLEVTPMTCTSPLRSEQVFIATVLDADGKPRRQRRIEWLLEGVGSIVEVDESGFFSGRGYKVDNKYAVSYTDTREHRITRGNDNPMDDFTIEPGQTWCVVTSAVEGDTALTVYAPGIHDWDKHRVYVRAHWMDAQWTLPTASAVRAGTGTVLTTNLAKHSDQRPLSNYKVRYRIIDGAAAVLSPQPTSAGWGNGDQDAVVVSDQGGTASVRIVQPTAQLGKTRVRIEIIRPAEAANGSGESVIHSSETTIDWQAPKIHVSTAVPPAVQLGDETPVTISVANAGTIPAQAMIVRGQIPDGVEFVRSDPPAQQSSRGELAWSLPGLEVGAQHQIQAVFVPKKLGPVVGGVSVETTDGLRAARNVSLQVTKAQLEVGASAPALVVVGETFPVSLEFRNPGSGPVVNLRGSLRLENGLSHVSGANPVAVDVESIGPGLSQAADIYIAADRPGVWNVGISATADGGLSAQTKPLRIEAVAGRVLMQMSGPGVVYLTQGGTWTIQVKNPGPLPLGRVQVRISLPPELRLYRGIPELQTEDGVSWCDLGTLEVDQVREVRFTAVGQLPIEGALVRAQVVGSPIVERFGMRVVAQGARPIIIEDRAAANLAIRGIPALQIELHDERDPILVGDRVRYRAVITNVGTVAVTGAQVQATFSTHLQPERGTGQGTARIDGQKMEFPIFGELLPGRSVECVLEATARSAGDARCRVELSSRVLGESLSDEESTQIIPKADRPTAEPN